MRLAIIAPPWAPVPPTLYGGIEQAIDAEARGVADAGHDVTLFTTGDSGCPVPSHVVLDRAEGGRMGHAVPELRYVMNAYEAVEDFDLVHDHTVIGPVYAQGRARQPVLKTIHGPLDAELADIYRRISADIDLIAISHAQVAAAPDIRVTRVIHHGVDPGAFPVGDGDGGYFLFLGRMTPEKGAHRAIQAARTAGVPLVVAGKAREPAEKAYFADQVQPHLGHGIDYVGEVPHEEKLSLIGRARATLFPIRWNEPFGLVMIESLACGTPVLAFASGAVPEVIEDGVTGRLCQDEAGMAEAIAHIDEIDRRRCRRAVEQYFSLDRMVTDHIDLFDEVLSHGHEGHGTPSP